MSNQVDYVEELNKKYKQSGQSASDKKSVNINKRVDYASQLSKQKRISTKHGAETAVKVLQILVLVTAALNILSIFAAVFGFNILSDTIKLTSSGASTEIPAAFPGWIELFLFIISGTAGAWILLLIPTAIIICVKSDRFPVGNLIVWIITIALALGGLFLAWFFSIKDGYETFASRFIIVFIFLIIMVADIIMLGNLLCGNFMESFSGKLSRFIDEDVQRKLMIWSFTVATICAAMPLIITFLMLFVGIFALVDPAGATGTAKVFSYLLIISRYLETAACILAGVAILLMVINEMCDSAKVPVGTMVRGLICMSLNLLIAYFVRWAIVAWPDSSYIQLFYTIPCVFYAVLIILSVKLNKK